MNIYAQVAFVPHRHRTLWAAAKMFSLAALPLLFPLFPLFLRIFSAPLFALPSRTFRWCSGWWGGWVVGWLVAGWRFSGRSGSSSSSSSSLAVVLCERSRTRLIRHVRVLYELWPRRGSGHQNGEILDIYSGERVSYIRLCISKAERCRRWHINFAHQRYN